MKDTLLLAVAFIVGCAHFRPEIDLATHQEVFEQALSARSASIRYACQRTLVADIAECESMVVGQFRTQDPRRKDLAATILFQACRAKYADSLAEYLVSKLEDPHYYFRGIDAYLGVHRHGLTWGVEVDGKMQHVRMRCPFSAILEIGSPAVPYLERMTQSEDLGATVNAQELLREIKKKASP